MHMNRPLNSMVAKIRRTRINAIFCCCCCIQLSDQWKAMCANYYPPEWPSRTIRCDACMATDVIHVYTIVLGFHIQWFVWYKVYLTHTIVGWFFLYRFTYMASRMNISHVVFYLSLLSVFLSFKYNRPLEATT